MNNREIVQTLLDSVQKGDFVKTKSLLADNFQFSGPTSVIYLKEVWLILQYSV